VGRHTKWDKLRDDLQSTLDRQKRSPIRPLLQEIPPDEFFTCPVAPSLNPFMMAKYVKEFAVDLNASHLTATMWLDK
jgi:hypothetical protein